VGFMKKICVALLLFFLVVQPLAAVGASHKQVILNLLNTQNRVLQFFAQLQTTTYFQQEQEPVIKNTYQQDILWIRNEFLAVEIFNKKNDLVHLSYHNKNSGKKFDRKFELKSSFSALDVEHLFTGFYSKTEEKLLQFYESLGINYFHIKQVEENNQYYYQLGKDSAYIFLNKENYRTEKLVRNIYYNGEKLQFVVLFKDWDFQKPQVPKTIEYYLNGNLFKKDEVLFLQFRGLAARRSKFISDYEK
jgi:hypothetical protein